MRTATTSTAQGDDGSFVVLAPLESPSFDFEGMGYSAVSAVVGPPARFEGAAKDEIYASKVKDFFSTFSLGDFKSRETKAIATRSMASSLPDMITILKRDNGKPAFGIFAPDAGDITILHHMSNELGIAGMSVITNRLANSSTAIGKAREISTTYREMRHVTTDVDTMTILLVALITIGFVCSTTISILYPTFERINNVRALQYSNSVSVRIIPSYILAIEVTFDSLLLSGSLTPFLTCKLASLFLS